MDTVINCTIGQLCGCIVAVCAGIVTISAAAGVVISAVSKMRKPNEDQNKRLDEIEKRIDEHDKWFAADKHRLEGIEEGNRVTQRAILALLDHSIDGNNTQQMKDAKDELQKYLIER